MKAVLFCQNPYAFGILLPIMDVLKEEGDSYLWFVKASIASKFPFKDEVHTSDIKQVALFQSDALFVPGNEVPFDVRGVKTQIFHGFAGEKKGHFRIRHYFDLYLTQGPYFTNRFEKLKAKHKNFEVVETGWPKLDVYGKELHKYRDEKKALLETHAAKKIVLYAPTFSPSLTSAPLLFEALQEIATNNSYLILIKFHDLMTIAWIDAYKKLAATTPNIRFESERNIIKFLLMSDILISDTSSVVYEFLLLDKPVITFRNSSQNIRWENIQEAAALPAKLLENLTADPFAKERSAIAEQYHPYRDGNAALRMVNATKKYIAIHGVPEKRKLSFLRRMKIHKIFGKSHV